MILVMGHIKLATGEGAKIADTLVAHMAACAAEDGCEFYNLALDLVDPDLIRISERWASPAAIAAHGEAEHQKAFGRALRGFTIERL
jgi:quinol monooxygenase YgiN